MRKINQSFKSTLFLAGCLIGMLYQFPAFAQSNEKEKPRRFLVEPYVMFPNMDGKVGLGDVLSIPVDASPGDIFSQLQIAFLLNTEYKTPKWAITSDLVFMRLNQDIRTGPVIRSGELDEKQFIWEAAGLYKVMPFWEVGIGGRLNILEMEVNAVINQLPGQGDGRKFSKSQTESWYDPIIVTRLKTNIKDKWDLTFRGDIGGFGIGSDLTWQLQGYVGYRFSKLFLLTAGYRVVYTDFNRGESPPDAFIFDMHQFGPILKFGFNF